MNDDEKAKRRKRRKRIRDWLHMARAMGVGAEAPDGGSDYVPTYYFLGF